ncbi:MAG: SDR family NAD(P)-dependent oxidoreductase [Thermoleophilia bacterium]|nr:SDR family NAD(P)-dependent oxidoreductase [Thermoleophilia bacterium]
MTRSTALVTGSARRVGRAIAEALVADGWDVMFHAREGARAREACEEVGGAGWVGADLLRAEAADEIAAAAAATFGEHGLDLLVNSAATFERVDRWDGAGIDGWQRAMAVNARAPYLLTCALLPMLRTARGLVVNVSDHAAQEHWPAYPVHSASKAALESLTLSGAAALAPDGVRMVAISPGTILPPDEWDEDRVARERAARRVGSPDVLVDAIRELAGDPLRSGEIVVLPG